MKKLDRVVLYFVLCLGLITSVAFWGTTASLTIDNASGWVVNSEVVLESDSTTLAVGPSGVNITGLPTSELVTVGDLWVDGVTIKISDGP